MPKTNSLTKRVQLDKTNLRIVVAVAIACFVTVFCLVAAKALVGQLSYQNKVIDKKEEARKQLIASVESRDKLVSQYKLFVGNETNIIGGAASGTTDRDGDNAKIILDALPSKYDYPALVTSLEKLTNASGLQVTSIGGTDDEVTQSAAATPSAVDMPFTLAINGSSQATQDFLSNLQRSIRPIQIQQISFTGSDDKLSTNITAKTYFQPEKSFQVNKEVVK